MFSVSRKVALAIFIFLLCVVRFTTLLGPGGRLSLFANSNKWNTSDHVLTTLSIPDESTSALTELQELLHRFDFEPIDNIDLLPPKTLLTVHVFSNVDYMVQGFEFRRKYYYPYQSNHSVLIIVPIDALSDMLSKYMEMLHKKGTVPVGVNPMYKGLIDSRSQVQFGPLLRTMDGGVELFFQGIVPSLPSWYSKQKTHHISCSRRTWSLDYALYSGAVFSYHLLKLPILERYEFMLKIDSDVHFHKRIPDLGRYFRTKGTNCVVAHSTIHRSTDCEKDLPLALRTFSEAFPQYGIPKSIQYPWCDTNGRIRDTFYCNFVAYSTRRLLLHNTVQALSDFLYHNFSQGYFQYRWGDQATPIGFLCMIYEMKDVAHDDRVCDLTYLRNTYFNHL